MSFTISRASPPAAQVSFRYEYGTFANYSPRGASELSVRSRSICGSIKAGRVAVMESAVRHLGKPRARILRPFLNPEVTLVPVPRSAPLTENALWPSKVIADILAARGFGAEVCALIERTVAVRKSSTSRTGERPLIPEHMASMRIRADMLAPVQITLVDGRERSLGGIFIGIGKRDAVAMAASRSRAAKPASRPARPRRRGRTGRCRSAWPVSPASVTPSG